ncbi:MAG: hypothetical protein GY790_09825 [Bacteroidetes bacterium]|nr:hypothetical protein [Bacteroidota bacterium]
MSSFRSNIQNSISLARYNMRIIFGGKFIYFVLAAFIFFLVFGTIVALDSNTILIEEIYGLLAFPAILLIFFPSVFGIQNDADQRTLEIIFGIPDYRYKVWLVRYVMILFLAFLLLFPFAGIAWWALISFPVMTMILHLMVLVLLVSSLGFCLSTVIKNGNATAVIMVVLGLAFLILTDGPLYQSRWNIFLNPFAMPRNMNEIVWNEIVRQNRIIMGVLSLVLILLGLLNLQQREKFLR